MSFDSLGLSEPLVRAVTRTRLHHSDSDPDASDSRRAERRRPAGRRADRHRQDRRLHAADPATSDSHAPRAATGSASARVRALILTPTRELAAQVEESVRAYGKYLKLKSTVMFGGVGINPQIDAAASSGVDIVVATPGRLLDHMQQKTIDLSHRRDPRARRSRPHARHGLHPRHQARAREAAAEAPEPAVLGHLLRRDQDARRQPARLAGADRSRAPQYDGGDASRRRSTRWTATRSASCSRI